MLTFHSENIEYNLDKQPIITSWLMQSALSESQQIDEVSIVFCSDDHLLEMNKQYLNHDYYTDIITFQYDSERGISGDLFVSIDRVKDNAKKLNINTFDELCRVMIHGILHLCGYGDKTPEEEALMRSKEDFYLNLRDF